MPPEFGTTSCCRPLWTINSCRLMLGKPLSASLNPISARHDKARALMQPPQTLSRGNVFASTSSVWQPARASCLAATAPAGPAPMTTVSHWRIAAAVAVIVAGVVRFDSTTLKNAVEMNSWCQSPWRFRPLLTSNESPGRNGGLMLRRGIVAVTMVGCKDVPRILRRPSGPKNMPG